MVRKYLRFYKLVYGLDGARGGYALIIDGNFIFACLKVKIDIKERMMKLLQGADVRLFVTKSILSELQAIGAKGQAAYEYAKRSCELINDDHLAGETASQKLIKFLQQQHRDWLAAPTSGSSNGNRGSVRRYLVASQDKELRVSLGSIPGVPLIYLNMVAIVLEPPSNASKEFNKEIEAHKVSLSSSELSVVQRASKQKTKKRKAPGADDDEDDDKEKEEEEDEDEQEDEPEQAAVVGGGERKKHKAKAPNPLAALAPKQDSSRQKRLKNDKFKRR